MRASRTVGLVVVLAALAAGLWWMRRAPAEVPASSTDATTQAPSPSLSPLGMRIVVMSGAPGTSAAITVRLFHQTARQAALDRAAAAQVPPPAGVAITEMPPAVRVEFTEAEWLQRIAFDAVSSGGATTRLSGLMLRRAPTAAMSLDAQATLTLMFECPAGAVPPSGSRIIATFQSADGPVRSNAATIGDAPAAGVTALTADARVARVLGDITRLDAAATALSAAAPNGVDGPYYRGLAQQARGELDAALASYRAAFARIDQTQPREPGGELPQLIRALEQRVRR